MKLTKMLYFFNLFLNASKITKKFSQNEILPKTIGMWWSPEKYNLQTKMLMREKIYLGLESFSKILLELTVSRR